MDKQRNQRNLPTTVDDAYAMTGAQRIDFSNVPEDKRAFISAIYDMTVIVEAANNHWKADWDDFEQPKYHPYILKIEGMTTYEYTVPFRSFICRDEETAKYVGSQFFDLWDIIIKGK